ncbi:hypothetical protein HZF05_17815 [Sphingomonas sp. CGMCC 1.13654]|uniref:Autotransporter domain-containing protein n=1 Tax=Sphingomonas chungangi TaxID=2683589 RepID=A0A838LAN6_9SPHN|nr:hypothetical protein [Sphingomonas chungangi]MBA2935940.1 hypothetical protein [Sphingomonas chungangi]MVW54631.1 hypothetical protein [Sphingomonas chungangi]
MAFDRVAARRFSSSPSMLKASTALGSLLVIAAFSAPAYAADECGTAANGTVVCTAAGNPYAGGISYTPAGDLHLTTDSDVAATNTVSVNGTGATHITNNGTITTTGSGTAFTPGAQGIFARGSSVTVDGTGMITTGGLNARGIDAATTGAGAVTINVGDITTTGTGGGGPGFFPNSSAIFANTDAAAIDVTAGNLKTAGDFASGIQAITNSGDIAVNTGAITTTGNNASGVNAQTYGTGTAIVTSTGTIDTAGQAAYGVVISARNGTATAHVGDINTTGFDSTALDVQGGTAANATFGSLSTTQSFSQDVIAQATGDVTVSGTNASTAAVDSGAVYAISDTGNASVTTTGTVATTGASSLGIYAGSNTGNATVVANNVSTAGNNSQAIFAKGANASVTVSGNVSTQGTRAYSNTNATAVTAIATDGTATVINNGTISTAGNGSTGIYANGTAGVAISGTGSVSTSGDYADAIFATSAEGPVNVTQGDISTTGQISRGVVASAPNGDVTVNVGNVSTSGTQSGPFFFSPAATGILATSGTGNVAVTAADVSTRGGYANGITARSNGGDVAVTAHDVSTSGANANGVFGYSTGAGNVVITTTGTVAATGGAGIVNYGVYGNVEGGTGNVSINSNVVNVSGGNAIAIAAKTSLGDADVKFGSVSSTGGGFNSGGVRARSYGGGAVTVSGANASTTGDFSYGVFAYSNSERATGTDNNGAVSVTTTGAVTTTGTDSVGIGAFAQNGAANVTANTVSTTGDGAIGIIASSVAGPASVTANGAISATGAPAAIQIFGGTTANLTLGAGGLLTAAGHGAELTSVTGSTINNGGTITGDGTAPILTATGGALIFNNTGRFTGIVGFTAGNDVVNNSGTYNAVFDQDFGAGTDTFNNSGTFRVLPNAATAGTVHLTGLEAFNNSGLVDLRNGHAGDMLDTSSTFAGSGGSTLGIDLASNGTSAASLADQVHATGAITGSTALLVNQVGANGAVLNSGTVFATGGAGSSPTAFTISSASINQGFIHNGVAFNPATNTYSLVATPGDAVFRALKINEGAQQLWYKSAEAWSSHMSDLRDAKFAGGGADGGRIWGQIYGSTVTRNGSQNVSAFGQSRAVNLSYRQDAYGAQLGMDLGSHDMGSGNFVFGVTGGYVNSDLTFSHSADRVNYSVANLGVYASYVSGSLFANVLGKYDYLWINSKSPLAGYTDKFHGMSYGAQGEVGFRLGGDSFYAEPVATIAYVRTNLKDIHALGQTLNFEDLDGLRGKAGIRVGSKMDMGGGAVAVIYAQGNYVHEFKGKDGLDFVSGGQSLAYNNQKIGDYGEGKIGFNVTTAAGVTGFVEGFGDYAKHGDYKGGGGRAGIRVKF